MKYLRYTIVSLLIMVGTLACTEPEPFVPEESFTRIYNDESFNSAYIPMEVAQAGDKGYFILSAYDAWNTYILRVDEQGDFLWDYRLEENIVNPINGLFYQDSVFYFFGMDDLSLQTLLLTASDATESASVSRTYGDIIYPLHSAKVDDGYLLVSYNRESYSTRLTKLSIDFTEQWHEEYEVEQDVEEFIIAHLTRIGDRLPFFAGQGGNNYFLNGYYNYSMSLLFVNQNDGTQTGVINGFRSKSALSSANYISGNTYALSRFEFGNNYIIPRIDLNTNGTEISTDLPGNEHPEMVDNAFVHTETIDANGREVTLFATSTKSGQMLLYAYDTFNGNLIGTHHLGRINPYEAIDFVPTNDGGLAVLGNTYANGRFSRISLTKISQEELISFTSD